MIDYTQLKLPSDLALDEEEKKLWNSLTSGECVSIFTTQLEKHYSQIAKEETVRNKNVSMRLTQEDYFLAKTKGMEEGLPYQVLLASIIHKWLHGKLKEG